MTENLGRVAKGAAAGLVGGLAASWVMNQFQGLLSKAQGSGGADEASQEEPATVKAAERVAAFAGRPLLEDQRSTGGQIAHYAMGAVSGAVYGAAAEISPVAAAGFGTAFGAVLWVIGDEIAVPGLGLSKSPREYPASTHGSALAAHLVYGVSTDLIRQLVLKIG